ncbi:MAG TPA: CoA ester lyase [Steroidobacter sp.]
MVSSTSQQVFDDGRAVLLMVPAHRPDRFAKAAEAGADGVIIDLEDAVPAAQKNAARSGLHAALSRLDTQRLSFWVRINGAGTAWHEDDVAAMSSLPIAGVVLAKAERPQDVERLSTLLGGGRRVIALIESAHGLAAARELAHVAGRLAFGSFDFSADVGSAHTREALLSARTEIVLASRLAGLPGPIDGATAAIDDAAAIESDAAHAAELGFTGKLVIHPRQVAPAQQGLRPSEAAIAWAQRVVRAMAADTVTVVDGAMVDRPIWLRAQGILRRAGLSIPRFDKSGES